MSGLNKKNGIARSHATLRAIIRGAYLTAIVAVAAPAVAQTAEMDAPTPLPDVSDAMLAPPPDARVRIASWDDAMARVRTRSPEYVTTMKSVERADAQARIALAALLPVVTGQGTYTHNFNQLQVALGPATLTVPPADVETIGAGVTWTPLSARAYHDWQTSRRAVDVARLDTQDKRRQIATGIVSAMLATLASGRVAELNRVGLRAALERQRLTEARLAYGQGTPLDVDRANKDVATARRLVVDGDEALRRAREALGVALGSPEPIAVATDLDLEGFERAVASTCRLNDAIESRPDVAAARRRFDIAKRSVTSAELAPLPTIGVQAQAAHSTSPTLGPNDTYSFGAVLTVPLYDGGVRYGQLRDARAAEDQAHAALDATRLAAIASAARAKRGVDVARTDRDVSKTERDLAAQIDARTRDAYSRGRGTSLDLVTSAEQLRSAEINLAILDSQYSEARAAAVLENAECTF